MNREESREIIWVADKDDKQTKEKLFFMEFLYKKIVLRLILLY